MKTELLLVRHGNTFAPGDKVVWAGARTDLPLTKDGRAQAEQFGKMLKIAKYRPARILTGPLQRTRQHADIISQALNLSKPIDIHNALREIDYGIWEGRSTEEIERLGGGDELTLWTTKSQWPHTPNWQPDEATVQRDILHLMQTLSDIAGLSLLITSNGILRFFARATVNPPLLSDVKVRTGHWCRIVWQGEEWRIINWNYPPDSMLT